MTSTAKRSLQVSLAFTLAALIASPARPTAAQTTQSGAAGPVQLTSQQDRQRLMDLLQIASIGSGANDRDPATYNAATADPYPKLPDPLLLKNGQKVTAADMWWKQRRPEIVEDFEREIYGRPPKNSPRVTWEVTNTTDNGTTIVKQLVGRVDNSAYPAVAVNIQATLTTPSNAKGPVPVVIHVAFRQHSGGHTDGPNWPTFLTFADRYIKVAAK